MNHNQIAKNNMYKKLLLFFAVPANAAIWAAFARLVAEIANFVSLNDDLDEATQTQAQVTTGITTGKSGAFIDMIKMTVEMAFKAFVWAEDNNNDELAHVFDVQLSDFDNIAEQTALDKVKNIRDGINTNIAGMAGVNLLPANVTALDGLIAAYEAVRSAPEVAIGHKETSTDNIVVFFNDIDKSLSLISRLIISEYSTTNPTLVGDFKNNKHIDDLPTHHSGIHLHITDAATEDNIVGATLSIPELGKTATSDIHGIAEIIKAKSGEYEATVSKPGYQPYNFLTKITRGKITSFEVELSTGSSGGVSTSEAFVIMNGINNVSVDHINANPSTTVRTQITGNVLHIYASATAGEAPGSAVWVVADGTDLLQSLVQFATLIGVDSNKKFVNVFCPGPGTGHFILTFTNIL